MKLSTKKSSPKFRLAGIVLELLRTQNIDAICMKMYSSDQDIDIVIIDSENFYATAINLLIENGWQIKNNKSKLRERDKDFLTHRQFPFQVHLHKYFSWNTVPYLNSQMLYQRKRQEKKVFLPSFEDELLIIAAHSLFENMQIISEEQIYGTRLIHKKLDKTYMNAEAEKFNWKDGLLLILNHLDKKKLKLSILDLLSVRIKKLINDLFTKNLPLIINEIIAYLLIDWLWCYRKQLKNHDIS